MKASALNIRGKRGQGKPGQRFSLAAGENKHAEGDVDSTGEPARENNAQCSLKDNYVSSSLNGSPWTPGQEPSQALDEWTRASLSLLRERAETIQHRFESALRAAGQERPRREWGRIAVRIREQRAERATPGGFSIEWVTYQYGNTPGGKIYLSEYLPKGEGDRYPKSAFRGLARPWQLAIIDEAERQFSRIRKLAREVAQVRARYRAATRELAEMDEARAS